MIWGVIYSSTVILNSWVVTLLGVKQPFHRDPKTIEHTDIYVMISSSSKIIAMK